MPNICENTIQINGKEKDFEKFLKDTEDMGYEGRFNIEDENIPTINLVKAKPMPEEFNVIHTGSALVDDERVDLWWYRNTETGEIDDKSIFDDDEKWVAEKVPQDYQDKLTNKFKLPFIIIVKTPIKHVINPITFVKLIFSLKKKYEIKIINTGDDV